MKIFGKELFKYKKPAELMYDFAQHGLLRSSSLGFVEAQYLTVEGTAQTGMTATKKKKKEKKVEEPKKFSPKELFEMKALNNNDFKIQSDPKYLDEQIKEIDEKLSLLPPKPKKSKNNEPQPYEWGGVRYGRQELESIRERLNNRKRLSEFKDVTDEFPHTSSQLISELLEAQKHLRAEKADTFVPDFPKTAVAVMKDYENFCLELCNKKPVFYVIADQKDFEQRDKRRDPILLAQSPFGHFWQILGAWDEEMIFLGDL